MIKFIVGYKIKIYFDINDPFKNRNIVSITKWSN